MTKVSDCWFARNHGLISLFFLQESHEPSRTSRIERPLLGGIGAVRHW
jgi:hypothetical protein